MLKRFFTIISSLGLMACGQANSNNPTESSTNTTMPSLTKDQQMDTAFFWQIMDYAFAKGKFDNKLREQIILEQLIKLTPAQIQEFEIIFQQMNNKASTSVVMAIPTIIEGGSSDDGFYYFRCWLISLGKKNFDETLKNPDYIASLDFPFNKAHTTPNCEFEELIPLSDQAYGIVTKKDPTTDTSFPRSHAENLGLFYDTNVEIKGVEWTEDELPEIAPLLYKKYWNQ